MRHPLYKSLVATSFAVIALTTGSRCFAQAMPATGSIFKFHGADVGVAAAGQYTTSITNQTTQEGAGINNGDTLPHQATTDSPGVLFTLRDHPVSWAGIELNYQYTKLSERYFVTSASAPKGGANYPYYLPTSFHEATAAYLFHLNFRKVKPYMGVGGGAIDFVPTTHGANQWRGTGLVDIGVDLQTHSNLGFRFGGRGLAYRAPNYYSPILSSSRWVTTTEPYAGVYIKF